MTESNPQRPSDLAAELLTGGLPMLALAVADLYQQALTPHRALASPDQWLASLRERMGDGSRTSITPKQWAQEVLARSTPKEEAATEPKPLGKVSDCPDCSSVDYCRAHLEAMMATPEPKPRAIVVGSVWLETSRNLKSHVVELDEKRGVRFEREVDGRLTRMWFGESVFRRLFTHVSDPPAEPAAETGKEP